MAIKKGLGRGFDTLIPTQILDDEFDPTLAQDEQISQLRHLKIDDVMPNEDQPRRHFDEVALSELAASIKEHGVVQPIVVVPKGEQYEIVAGERRWRASKLAGIDKIPALVRTLTDQHKLELSLIENLQRQDLNALEPATAYLKLNQQFNMGYEEIGQRVGGKAYSTIGNTLRLLGLPKQAKHALVEGKITEGHARQILAMRELPEQLKLLNLIIKNDWPVRKTEQYVIGFKEGKKDHAAGAAKIQTESTETKAIGERLRADVSIKSTAKGGKLMITFRDQKDFERITSLLLG